MKSEGSVGTPRSRSNRKGDRPPQVPRSLAEGSAPLTRPRTGARKTKARHFFSASRISVSSSTSVGPAGAASSGLISFAVTLFT